jgi:NAD(P)-dependent dehydrogenase (short-subunit alcohol dehydrogenase family)
MKVSELFNVQGNVAFVTGAASGLGKAYAEVMAQNGARVMMTDIDGTAVEEQAAQLRATGCVVETFVLDIADLPALRAAIESTVERWGRLDTVFANAGISAGPGFDVSPAGEIEAIDLNSWNKVIDINLTAAMVTIQAAAKHMKPQRSGRIIVTSSIGGLRSEPMVGYAYIASKAAIANVVRQAAIELAPHNILVNAIAPGPFLTNIAGGRLHREPEVVAKFSDMVPLGRIAQPDEIKGLALLLASPAGSFMTGTVIPIDGGTTAV